MQKRVINEVLTDIRTGESQFTFAKGPMQGCRCAACLVGSTDPRGDGCNRVEATVALAVRDFAIVLWTRDTFKGQWQDAEAVDRIIPAARAAGKTFDLDEADWKWLKTKLEEHGPTIFGANAVMIRRSLDQVVEGDEVKAQAKKTKVA